MKEGIHPNYVETTITCACGNVIKTRSTKENIELKSAPSAILSTPVSRSLLIQADVLTASRSVSVWTSNFDSACA